MAGPDYLPLSSSAAGAAEVSPARKCWVTECTTTTLRRAAGAPHVPCPRAEHDPCCVRHKRTAPGDSHRISIAMEGPRRAHLQEGHNFCAKIVVEVGAETLSGVGHANSSISEQQPQCGVVQFSPHIFETRRQVLNRSCQRTGPTLVHLWTHLLPRVLRGDYCLKTTGGPLTRFILRSTLTSTRLAILTSGIPLFIPYSLRPKSIVPLIVPDPVPLPVIVNVNFSCLVTPRIVSAVEYNRIGAGLFNLC
jgi:hypothetical protein